MTKLVVYNSKGKEVGKVSLDEYFLKNGVNKGVIYQVINKYSASGHRGTHKTKSRGEVSGGGKKPWRQKGTGRARFGSTRNPIWRGGGVAFGPTVRSYSYSVPRKARQLALLEAIKSKIQSKKFVVFDKILLEGPKTKNITAVIKALKLGNKCLLIVEELDNNVRLASRNIPGFSAKQRSDVNALDVLKHDKLAISEESLNNLKKGTGK